MPQRRSFLASLAIAPLLRVDPSPAPSPAPTPAVPGPLAQAHARLVEERFGKHLEPGELEAITRLIDEGLPSTARLRSVALSNADEPVTTFAARGRSARPGPA